MKEEKKRFEKLSQFEQKDITGGTPYEKPKLVDLKVSEEAEIGGCSDGFYNYGWDGCSDGDYNSGWGGCGNGWYNWGYAA